MLLVLENSGLPTDNSIIFMYMADNTLNYPTSQVNIGISQPNQCGRLHQLHLQTNSLFLHFYVYNVEMDTMCFVEVLLGEIKSFIGTAKPSYAGKY